MAVHLWQVLACTARSGCQHLLWPCCWQRGNSGGMAFREQYHSATSLRASTSGVYHLQVKMVTGDQLQIAIETCRRLGMGTNIIEGKDVTFEDHRISPELAHQVSQCCNTVSPTLTLLACMQGG